MKPHKLFLFFGLLLCSIAKADFIPMPGDNDEEISITVIFENPSQKIDSAQAWVTWYGERIFLPNGESPFNDATRRVVPAIFEWTHSGLLQISASNRHERLPDTLEIYFWSGGKRYDIPWEKRLGVQQQYFHVYADYTELNDHPQKYLWEQWLLYFIITLLVELAISASFFMNEEFRKKALIGVLIINSITHPLLFFISHLFNQNPDMASVPYNFGGELIVIATEFFFLWAYLKTEKIGRLLLFSFIANIASLTIGAIITSALQ